MRILLDSPLVSGGFLNIDREDRRNRRTEGSPKVEGAEDDGIERAHPSAPPPREIPERAGVGVPIERIRDERGSVCITIGVGIANQTLWGRPLPISQGEVVVGAGDALLIQNRVSWLFVDFVTPPVPADLPFRILGLPKLPKFQKAGQVQRIGASVDSEGRGMADQQTASLDIQGQRPVSDAKNVPLNGLHLRPVAGLRHPGGQTFGVGESGDKRLRKPVKSRGAELLAGSHHRVCGYVGRADHQGGGAQVLLHPGLDRIVRVRAVVLSEQAENKFLGQPPLAGGVVWGWRGRRIHGRILPRSLGGYNRNRVDFSGGFDSIPNAVQNIF